VIALPKPREDPKFHKNLRPISLLSTTGKLFEKVILKIVQRHIENRKLLKANQFGFHAHHGTTLQCIRLADHTQITLGKDRSQGLPSIHQTIFPFKSERLNANIILTLLKTLISSVMTSAVPTCEFGVESCRIGF
jgi:hypothetical protein